MATEEATSTAAIEVPAGFKLHTENTSHILLPDNNEAFLNPVQEFNRDLSIACIQTWAAEQAKMQASKWLQRQEQEKAGNGPSKKRRKGPHASATFRGHLTEALSERWGRRHRNATSGECRREPFAVFSTKTSQLICLRSSIYLIQANSSSQGK